MIMLFSQKNWSSVCLYGLLSVLLLCLIAGCGFNANASTGGNANNHSSIGPAASTQVLKNEKIGDVKTVDGCQPLTEKPQQGHVLYSVVWEAVPAEADSGTGVSTLRVAAFDTVTGQQLWVKEPTTISTNYGSSTNYLANGILYIMASNSKTYVILALDAHDGHKLWEQQRQVTTSVGNFFLCGQHILFLTDNTLQVLDAKTGKPDWTYQSDNKVSYHISTVTTDTVYLSKMGTDDSKKLIQTLIALNAADGVARWHQDYQTDLDNAISITASDQAVYIIKSGNTTRPAKISALRTSDGATYWTSELKIAIPDPLEVKKEGVSHLVGGNYRGRIANNTLYLNDGKELVALDGRSGQLLWRHGHQYNPVAILSEHELYGIPMDQSTQLTQGICAIDPTSGAELWCRSDLKTYFFTLNSQSDRVFVTTYRQDNPLSLEYTLQALSKNDGSTIWSYTWKAKESKLNAVSLWTVLDGQSLLTSN